MLKFCSKCKIGKGKDSFHKNSRNKDRLQNECKDCRSKRNYESEEKSCSACQTLFKGSNNKCRLCSRKEKAFCLDCGKRITKESKRCKPCSSKFSGWQSRENHPSWKGGKLDKGGYMKVYLPDHHRADVRGYVCEHIIIMEEHLGRKIVSPETIHHKNGVRSDNRLENLELWTSNHPKGQRVEDLISWAKEILQKYDK